MHRALLLLLWVRRVFSKQIHVGRRVESRRGGRERENILENLTAAFQSAISVLSVASGLGD